MKKKMKNNMTKTRTEDWCSFICHQNMVTIFTSAWLWWFPLYYGLFSYTNVLRKQNKVTTIRITPGWLTLSFLRKVHSSSQYHHHQQWIISQSWLQQTSNRAIYQEVYTTPHSCFSCNMHVCLPKQKGTEKTEIAAITHRNIMPPTALTWASRLL